MSMDNSSDSSDEDSFHSASDGEADHNPPPTPTMPEKSGAPSTSLCGSRADVSKQPESTDVPKGEEGSVSAAQKPQELNLGEKAKKEAKEETPRERGTGESDTNVPRKIPSKASAKLAKSATGDDGDWFAEQLREAADKGRVEVEQKPKPRGLQEHVSAAGPGPSIWEWTADVVSAVGGGISSVMETGLGLPNPETMAKLSKAERLKLVEEAQKLKEPEPSLSSLSDDENVEVSSLKSRSNCSSGSDLATMANELPARATPPASPLPMRVGGFFGAGGGLLSGFVSGGLDVLESLGKKTFETLTVKEEGKDDRRRFILGTFDDTQDLSEVLRELRKQKNAELVGMEGEAQVQRGTGSNLRYNINFVALFEKGEGMFHLEGLEMLSKDQEKRTRALVNSRVFEEKLAEFCVEDVSECTNEDFDHEIKKSIQSIGLPYKPDDVLETNQVLTQELQVRQGEVDNEDEEMEVDAIHEAAINALATLTASSIQSLHKLAQLIIIAKDLPELDSLFAFTYLLCRRLSFFACHYANMLSVIGIGEHHSKRIDEDVTNIFFECSNACHYVKSALELLRPFFKR